MIESATGDKATESRGDARRCNEVTRSPSNPLRGETAACRRRTQIPRQAMSPPAAAWGCSRAWRDEGRWWLHRNALCTRCHSIPFVYKYGSIKRCENLQPLQHLHSDIEERGKKRKKKMLLQSASDVKLARGELCPQNVCGKPETLTCWKTLVQISINKNALMQAINTKWCYVPTVSAYHHANQQKQQEITVIWTYFTINNGNESKADCRRSRGGRTASSR